MKKIVIAVIVLIIVIQFIKPAKNISDDRTYDISTKYEVPAQVATLFENACNDCHTNKTRYPWYSEIQPFAWWLNDHVTDGKRHLNLSTFTTLPIAVQNHKLEEIGETVEEEEMPLPSYTWLGLHKEADLTPAQRQTIIQWAKAKMDTLKRKYPADSLVMKRRGPGGPPPRD